MRLEKTEAKKLCEVCGAVGDLANAGCTFLNRMPQQHSPCHKIKARLSRPVCAVRKIRSLSLPRVDIPYSLTAVGIDKKECDQAIVEKLNRQFNESLVWKKSQFQMECSDLRYVDEFNVKKILSRIFFYDYHKFNRMDRSGEDRDEKFFDTCAVIYSACGIELNGHKGPFPLKSSCLNVLKKVKGNTPTREFNQNATKLTVDVTGDGHVTSPVLSGGSVQEEGRNLQIPVSLMAEMKGVVFLHGKDVVVDQKDERYELDGDEVLIAINHPCGMAFGFYCYYNGLYI